MRSPVRFGRAPANGHAVRYQFIGSVNSVQSAMAICLCGWSSLRDNLPLAYGDGGQHLAGQE